MTECFYQRYKFLPHLSHKIELNPTATQIAFFRQCAGAARFFWNRSLAQWKEAYDRGEKINDSLLQKQVTIDKREDSSLTWATAVPVAAIANSIRNLGVAFDNFFRRVKKGEKPGYPKFKSKHKSKVAFSPWYGGRISLNAKKIRIPNLGWVRMREELRFKGKIVSGTISERAGKWFVSITIETEAPAKARTGNANIGLDFGCRDMVVTSNNEVIAGPKPFKKLMGKIQRKSRALSRKVKGSKNRAKAKHVLAKLQAKIANIRDAFQHELTTKLVLANSMIAIEDLNVKGMTGLKTLRKSLSDHRLAKLRYMLSYKAELYGSTLYVVDRFFPSSKTCSACGAKKEDLSLSDRVFYCDCCGTTLSRDHNAAINLRKQIPMLDREFTLVEIGR